MRLFKIQWWLMLVLCCFAWRAQATELIELDLRKQQIAVGSQLQFFAETDAVLDIDAVLQQDASLPWQPLNAARINFGFRTQAFWFRAEIRNSTDTAQDWLLEQTYPLIDLMQVYLVQHQQIAQQFELGDQLPFFQRPIPHPEFLMLLHFPPRSQQVMYLRVENTEALEVPLTLWQPAAYARHNNLKGKLEGLFYGFLLVMALYNLVLAFLTRDLNYLYYANYVFSFVLTFVVQRGDGYAWFYPAAPGLQHVLVPVTLLLTYICGVQFARSFLRTREQLPFFEWLFKGLIVLALGLLPMVFVLDYNTLILSVVAYQLPLTVSAMAAAVILSLRKQRTAQIYLVGWSLLLLNLAGNALAKVGLIENEFFYVYGLRVGAAFEVVLFSLALAYRYNQEKDQRIKTERQLGMERQKGLETQKMAFDSERALRRLRETMLNQQKEANEQLEVVVQQRTADLELALSHLEQANGKLELLSEQDALTGLHNRRCFDRKLQEEWTRAMRAGEPLSLLMVDVDHFKQVNDQFGHPFGDLVLRQVAQAIRAAAKRELDVPARYGGEEFAIILVDTDETAAVELAQSLMGSVRDLVLQDEHQRNLTAITISVGVCCTVPPHGSTPDEWVGLADRALYFAKNSGRNCVAVAQGEHFHCV